MAKDVLTVQIGDKRYPAKRPNDESTFCLVDIACPLCTVDAPLSVSGGGRYIDPDARHDTWAAPAITNCCNQQIGTIRIKVSGTLFGIEEDERVMNMGIRIY